jgi:hypothetical protein
MTPASMPTTVQSNRMRRPWFVNEGCDGLNRSGRRSGSWVPMLLSQICSILVGSWCVLSTIAISGRVRLQNGVGRWRETEDRVSQSPIFYLVKTLLIYRTAAPEIFPRQDKTNLTFSLQAGLQIDAGDNRTYSNRRMLKTSMPSGVFEENVFYSQSLRAFLA